MTSSFKPLSKDYIFTERRGQIKFVGDFKGLYNAEKDPWQQSGRTGDMAAYYKLSRHRLSSAINANWDADRSDSVRLLGLEVGCGNGHVLKHLIKKVGGHWNGLDICEQAVVNARALNPESSVFVGDITVKGGPLPPNAVGHYDVIILSQILWYILPKMNLAVSNAVRLLQVGGLLVVSQAFLRRQRYGTRYCHGWPGALRFFLVRYPMLSLVYAQYDATTELIHHDGLMVFRKINNA